MDFLARRIEQLTPLLPPCFGGRAVKLVHLTAIDRFVDGKDLPCLDQMQTLEQLPVQIESTGLFVPGPRES